LGSAHGESVQGKKISAQVIFDRNGFSFSWAALKAGGRTALAKVGLEF